MAKSKVAPARSRTTLPRLELCAAVLLAKLMKKATTALDRKNIDTYAWTDSMITLSWIKGDPTRWKTFVANRVAEIQGLLPSQFWYHVKTEDNPVDIISRGADPSRLKNHSLWWNGPSWLKQNHYFAEYTILTQPPEERKMCHQTTIQQNDDDLTNRFSSLLRMTRVISYCNTFISYLYQRLPYYLTNDVNDIEVLTPGHFLIGRELISPPESIDISINTNLPERWRLVQKMKKDFWKAWSTEYLSRLQQRYKWKTLHNNIKPGQLVLLKEENVNPSRWPLARVSDVHPAADGTVRVVTLTKAGGSTIKRSMHKIIPFDPEAVDKEDSQPSIMQSNTSMVQKRSLKPKKKKEHPFKA